MLIALSSTATTVTGGPGLTINPGGGSIFTSEPAGNAAFTVVLNVQPASNVNVVINSTNTNEGRVENIIPATTLLFTNANWNTPQIVTVYGQDDGLLDGPYQAYSVTLDMSTSPDPTYAALGPYTLNAFNTDDDSPTGAVGILVLPTTVGITEGGANGQFSLSTARP